MNKEEVVKTKRIELTFEVTVVKNISESLSSQISIEDSEAMKTLVGIQMSLQNGIPLSYLLDDSSVVTGIVTKNKKLLPF